MVSISNQVPNFLPSASAFHFANDYPKSTPYPMITLPIISLTIGAGDAGAGMCGGFVYTVMDMFFHRPRITPPSYLQRPDANTSRFNYLARRLLTSFGGPPAYDNAAKAIDWIQKDDRALSPAMIAGEWPAIKADIDAGRPSPLMLVMVPKAGSFLDIGNIVSALKNGHQVLTYGYSLDNSGNLTLRIYDCNVVNAPECDQQTLKLNIANPNLPVNITSSQKHQVRGFFRSNFRSDSPLPFMPVHGVQLDVLAHLQGIGDRHFQAEEFVGTRGQGLRLEGFQISFAPNVPNLTMMYMAHIQNIGDTPMLPEGAFVGTRGQGRQIEGFAIQLAGSNASQYNISYMAHIQGVGDTQIMRNGAFCGSRGQGRRVEGMMVAVTHR